MVERRQYITHQPAQTYIHDDFNTRCQVGRKGSTKVGRPARWRDALALECASWAITIWQRPGIVCRHARNKERIGRNYPKQVSQSQEKGETGGADHPWLLLGRPEHVCVVGGPSGRRLNDSTTISLTRQLLTWASAAAEVCQSVIFRRAGRTGKRQRASRLLCLGRRSRSSAQASSSSRSSSGKKLICCACQCHLRIKNLNLHASPELSNSHHRPLQDARSYIRQHTWTTEIAAQVIYIQQADLAMLLQATRLSSD